MRHKRLKMKLLVVLALVGLVSAAVGEEEFVAPIERDYHNAIGIPEAARIKAAEEALDFDGARIVGGSAAGLGQYPYLGGLVIAMNNGGTSVCGSTLISNTRAVTAAHCWGTTVRQFTVVLGSTLLFSGGTRVVTSDVEVHGNYNSWTLVNDVAVIRLSWVSFNNNINSLPLATGSNQLVGTWAWAAGYGRTSDSAGIGNNQFVSHVQVQVITNAVCAATYGSTVQSSTICVATTGGRGTCGGDSGGPLVANNQLIGITSFGHVSGCQRNFPAGFARVTSFASWIQARL